MSRLWPLWSCFQLPSSLLENGLTRVGTAILYGELGSTFPEIQCVPLIHSYAFQTILGSERETALTSKEVVYPFRDINRG